MKEKVQKEYYKRVRAVLKSKLNGGNVLNAINIWAVATVRYGAGIVKWNKGELDKIDRQAQKLMEVYTHALLLAGCTYQELREVEGC